ncbi:MAG: hypothetical protein ACREDJ_04360 [Methylocella sp.]
MAAITAENGRLDIAVPNAGHNVLGPAEPFTPERYAELRYHFPGALRGKRAARIGGRRASS